MNLHKSSQLLFISRFLAEMILAFCLFRFTYPTKEGLQNAILNLNLTCVRRISTHPYFPLRFSFCNLLYARLAVLSFPPLLVELLSLPGFHLPFCYSFVARALLISYIRNESPVLFFPNICCFFSLDAPEVRF